jgi:segregation and condensation protein A
VEYNVKLDAFEGPLDLLLHLINRLEIDIYDIPVSEITDQYLDFIHTMQELQLDVAGEYLLMASTLLAIKSRMLLPKNEEEIIDEDLDLEAEGIDPRGELIRKLLEYRKFKTVAEELKNRESKRSLVYSKPPADIRDFFSEQQSPPPVTDVSLYDMVSAFQNMLKRKKLENPQKTTIQREDIPIETRMGEIVAELGRNQNGVAFFDLFPYPNREHIVTTFLAILELMKDHSISCDQENNFTNIMIFRGKGEQ